MSKKLFSEITGQVHDASGIDNPHDYYWEEINGIWYPIEVDPEIVCIVRVVKPMKKADTQLELQKEMIDAGINIVTCGNCGRVVLHRTEAIEITCPDCKLTSEPCDFPDLNF